MNPPSARRGVRGFTLMELLVVLVITAMLMTMLFQSLGIFRRAQERVDARTVIERRQELIERWFADSVAALYPRDATAFTGDRLHWQGVTLQPLQGSPGAPTDVRWTLAEDAGGAQLEYVVTAAPDAAAAPAAAATPIDLRLPVAEAHFAYLDETGLMHGEWPPGKGLFPTLPAAVAVVSGQGADEVVLQLVAVRGPLRPYPQPFEPEEE